MSATSRVRLLLSVAEVLGHQAEQKIHVVSAAGHAFRHRGEDAAAGRVPLQKVQRGLKTKPGFLHPGKGLREGCHLDGAQEIVDEAT